MAVDTSPRAKPRASRSTARLTAGLAIAALVIVALGLYSLTVGAKPVGLDTAIRFLGADDGTDLAYIVREIRLPRLYLGLAVGAGLGLAGALMQALTRNPLADPGLLGVEIGASTAVVIAIAVFGVVTPGGYVWFALAGAAATSVVVYLLGSGGRGATPERMVLAGAAVTAVMTAFVGIILLLDGQTFDRYRFWVIGSLAGRGFDVLWQTGPLLLLGAVIALSLGRGLNALALGDEVGRALGVQVERTRLAGALAVTLLCGAATAAAGPIAFVGLAVPHMARVITGPDNRWVLAYSLFLAPILVLGADITGRVVSAPGELEVGIVMALIGAPVFIALARRRRIAQL
ncbi:ABC-type Fe3+-siderophore transport system, permease component [Alloactinosynnema sp. L-07]|uniref:FecCD family ABC transporter permease n=1 Tax=Alloactinosynnema sp. L-07 TaxID=1653480 RepID=UPI00065F0A7A|nr:iron chelate uptake ABC transporter family permease subunit [Alloactinosynnema sp. L-07]CRK56693.1 ABC-type Fe3+-siderophore transport system, permease component [Alloactinosynnema sp. L-07]